MNTLLQRDDSFFMNQALQEAHAAFDEGEVPVGAVIVKDGRVIARGHNRVEAAKDATAHAEILCIGAASQSLDDWRLEGCTLYVTLEPCPMCTGALINSRIDKIVFAARDNRLGAIHSNCSLLDMELLNRRIKVEEGILAEDCGLILKAFFKVLRTKKKDV